MSLPEIIRKIAADVLSGTAIGCDISFSCPEPPAHFKTGGRGYLTSCANPDHYVQWLEELGEIVTLPELLQAAQELARKDTR